MISLDTETLGVDLYHGAAPFFVTICDEEENLRWWEWDVDPLTREVQILEEDIEEIRAVFASVPEVVLQNPKFDVTALSTSGIIPEWDWSNTFDTLLAGHLLASNHPHGLDAMAIEYLGEAYDIRPYERALEEACKEARKMCKSLLPEWKIAKYGDPKLPSLKKSGGKGDKDRLWANDMWLPRAVARYCGEAADHPWMTVLADYSNMDSLVTLPLWKVMIEELERRGLWEIYLTRLKLLPIAHKMERRGVTISRERLDALRKEHSEEAERCGNICINIAAGMGYELELPKGGRNTSLEDFCFGWKGGVCDSCGSRVREEDLNSVELDDPLGEMACPKCVQKITNLKSEKGRSRKPGILRPKSIEGLGLRPFYSEKGTPILDKEVMEVYKDTLPQSSLDLAFINALNSKKKRSTAVTYIDGYKRFWLPLGTYNDKGEQCWQLWYRIHPQLNPTGTNTLRWSCSNPNEQNISKQEEANLRSCFGPGPGREWYSADAKNVELRIPAFEAQEPDLVYVFEHPNDPPYYGSYHLVVFDTLHPQLFKQFGKACKEEFESTWYQWVKNGNFAIIYGCQRAKADQTYHVQGAYDKIQSRFPKIANLSQYQMAFAEKYGYVETIPDKSLNWGTQEPKGYPLICTRTRYGVKPTIPLNYHVSGSAMWWTGKAMIRCQEQLDQWNRSNPAEDWAIALQVHDELVFDFPKAAHPKKNPKSSNLARARVLQKLMEQGGVDISVPTPVGLKYHEEHWAAGVTI